MIAEDGDVKDDRQEIAEVFAMFYSTLYENAQKILDLVSVLNSSDQENITDIRREEVAAQIKAMGQRKGADEGGIIAELLKHGGEEVEAELAEIFNDILRGTGSVPSYWKSAKIFVLRRSTAA